MTIDVNIPESVIDDLVEKVAEQVKQEADLDKIEDLESRLEDAERRIEDMPDDFACNRDLEKLEDRINDPEEADYHDLANRISDLEHNTDSASHARVRDDLSALYNEYREFKSEMLTLVESFRKVLNDFVTAR